jgi:hypothetical protein
MGLFRELGTNGFGSLLIGKPVTVLVMGIVITMGLRGDTYLAALHILGSSRCPFGGAILEV